MKVLAEGVETNEQRVLLRLAGCDEMQGYLFAKACPAKAIDKILARPPRHARRAGNPRHPDRRAAKPLSIERHSFRARPGRQRDASNSLPGLDFGLGSDVEMLRNTVRDFAQDKIAPHADEIDRSNRFPRELWPQMGELGLLGITVEEEFGGAGLGYLAHCVAMEEIRGLRLGRPVLWRAFQSLRQPVRRNGSDEQKRRYLPKLISGEHVGALAMSEPGAGSDVVSMRTRADQKGDRYILNGSKMWITNGPVADTLVVYAKTDRTAGARGITAFIVEKASRVSRPARSSTSSACAAPTPARSCSRIAKCRRENVLGVVGNGVNVLMSGLDYERTVLAAGPLGVMQACLDLVIPYVHQRTQFGQPIGRFQLMQAKLADMYVTLNAAKAYVYAVAKACDRGETTREDAAGAILYAAERATWMALETIQCLGGNGYINDYPAGRLLRDAKLYEIGAGTSEIRRMLIGREILRRRASHDALMVVRLRLLPNRMPAIPLGNAQAQTRKPTAKETTAIRDCLAKYGDDLDAWANGNACSMSSLRPARRQKMARAITAPQIAIVSKLAIWDDLLNANFKVLLDTLDEPQLKKARAMQRAWVGYRDTTCNFYMDKI